MTNESTAGPPADWPEADALIDTRGLLCPQPVLETRLALRDRPSGTVVQVVATDPHADLDLEVFCARAGHRLERQQTVGSERWFQIRKGRGKASR